MKLTKKTQLPLSFNGFDRTIRVNQDGYICLNDLMAYYPDKRLDNWLRLDSTKEWISVVEKHRNIEKSRSLTCEVLEITPIKGIISMRGKDGGSYASVVEKHRNIEKSKYLTCEVFEITPIKGIISMRGKDGGSYADEDIAIELSMWLSPEFKYLVIQSYKNGIKRKGDWNIVREISCMGYKDLSSAIKRNLPIPQDHDYANEARMMNTIVFGQHIHGIRDIATDEQLKALNWVQQHNTTMLDMGLSYDERKSQLERMWANKTGKKIT